MTNFIQKNKNKKVLVHNENNAFAKVDFKNFRLKFSMFDDALNEININNVLITSGLFFIDDTRELKNPEKKKGLIRYVEINLNKQGKSVCSGTVLNWYRVKKQTSCPVPLTSRPHYHENS